MGSHIRRRTYSATESRLGLWAKAQQLWFLCEPRCFALHCCVCGSHFQRSGMAVSIGRKVRALQLLFFDPGCCHHPFAEVTFLFWVIFFVINVKQGQQKGGGMTGEQASKDIQRSSRAAILCGPSWRLASCRLRTWEQREPTRRLDSTYFKILSAASADSAGRLEESWRVYRFRRSHSQGLTRSSKTRSVQFLLSRGPSPLCMCSPAPHDSPHYKDSMELSSLSAHIQRILKARFHSEKLGLSPPQEKLSALLAGVKLFAAHCEMIKEKGGIVRGTTFTTFPKVLNLLMFACPFLPGSELAILLSCLSDELHWKEMRQHIRRSCSRCLGGIWCYASVVRVHEGVGPWMRMDEGGSWTKPKIQKVHLLWPKDWRLLCIREFYAVSCRLEQTATIFYDFSWMQNCSKFRAYFLLRSSVCQLLCMSLFLSPARFVLTWPVHSLSPLSSHVFSWPDMFRDMDHTGSVCSQNPRALLRSAEICWDLLRFWRTWPLERTIKFAFLAACQTTGGRWTHLQVLHVTGPPWDLECPWNVLQILHHSLSMVRLVRLSETRWNQISNL